MDVLRDSRAQCRDLTDPDALFLPGQVQNLVKRVCTGCPIRLDCLREALGNRIEFGIWGGMTERERRALLRKHPHTWEQLLIRAALASAVTR